MSAPARAPTVAEYLSRIPDEWESAARSVAPYAAMTPAERLQELATFNGWVDVLLAGRLPEEADGEQPFWRHWMDPGLGRPA